MELSKQQEGMTCKEKDESWNFQRSKRELSIQLPWNLNGLGCTAPAGPLRKPRLEEIFMTWQRLRNGLADSVSLGDVNRENNEEGLFQWGDAEGTNKQCQQGMSSPECGS